MQDSSLTISAISQDDLARGVVRINEVAANLSAIQRMMVERKIETLAIPETMCLTKTVDALIHFVSNLEHSVAEHQSEE
jgi:hypothetical protein